MTKPCPPDHQCVDCADVVLLNGPDKPCECGETPGACCSPLPRNPDRRPGD